MGNDDLLLGAAAAIDAAGRGSKLLLLHAIHLRAGGGRTDPRGDSRGRVRGGGGAGGGLVTPGDGTDRYHDRGFFGLVAPDFDDAHCGGSFGN